MTKPLRDEKGRWLKGSTPNPNGRPSKVKEREYLEALQAGISTEDITEIAIKIREHLLAGNLHPQLIKVIFSLLIPAPEIHKKISILDERALNEVVALIGNLQNSEIEPSQYFFELNKMLESKANETKQ